MADSRNSFSPVVVDAASPWRGDARVPNGDHRADRDVQTENVDLESLKRGVANRLDEILDVGNAERRQEHESLRQQSSDSWTDGRVFGGEPNTDEFRASAREPLFEPEIEPGVETAIVRAVEPVIERAVEPAIDERLQAARYRLETRRARLEHVERGPRSVWMRVDLARILPRLLVAVTIVAISAIVSVLLT